LPVVINIQLLSYPFNDNFKAIFDIGYLTGRKKFLKNLEYRHGSSEFTLGIAYTGFHKNAKITSESERDSSNNKVTVTVKGGMNYSWNKAPADGGKYSGYTGPSVGFSVNFPLGQGGYFQTGFSFYRDQIAAVCSDRSMKELPGSR